MDGWKMRKEDNSSPSIPCTTQYTEMLSMVEKHQQLLTQDILSKVHYELLGFPVVSVDSFSTWLYL